MKAILALLAISSLATALPPSGRISSNVSNSNEYQPIRDYKGVLEALGAIVDGIDKPARWNVSKYDVVEQWAESITNRLSQEAILNYYRRLVAARNIPESTPFEKLQYTISLFRKTHVLPPEGLAVPLAETIKAGPCQPGTDVEKFFNIILDVFKRRSPINQPGNGSSTQPNWPLGGESLEEYYQNKDAFLNILLAELDDFFLGSTRNVRQSGDDDADLGELLLSGNKWTKLPEEEQRKHFQQLAKTFVQRFGKKNRKTTKETKPKIEEFAVLNTLLARLTETVDHALAPTIQLNDFGPKQAVKSEETKLVKKYLKGLLKGDRIKSLKDAIEVAALMTEYVGKEEASSEE